MRTMLISLPSSLILAGVFFCACPVASSPPPVVSMSKPNCSDTCGNITVPYPFGMSSACSANTSFLVVCRDSVYPPTLYLPSIDLQVTKISVEGTIVVNYPVAPINCTAVEIEASTGRQFVATPFTISADRNTFAVLGCRNSVFLNVNETEVLSGCIPTCRVNYTRGSCQIAIPPRSQELHFTYRSTVLVNATQSCGYAFPADKTWLSKVPRDNYSNPFDEQLVSAPLVLEWEFEGAKIEKYALCFQRRGARLVYNRSDSSCRGPNFDTDTYQYAAKQCSCCYGFRGNPYLDGGCVDIDECEERPHVCYNNNCVNEIGFFTCHDPTWPRVRNILLFSFGGLFVAGIFIPCASRAILKRVRARRRRRFFVRNGGLILEQKLSTIENGYYKKSKLFTSEEMEKATDRYSENRVLGRGGQGTVYKGMLTDGSIVAVKKSKTVQQGSDGESFINEVLILSQIIHRNIVRLLGFCLETESPILVYEFVPNGTLFEHIHGDPGEDFPLTWEMRLRIAVEIAGALSYLHSFASAPIFHRDIKSTNILLDEKYRAKVSDFGTSRSLAIDETHFTTRVCGTFGYLDPEYFQSNQFTEKSDVYSFGVVMVELLTGEKAVSSVRSETGRSLATHFLQSMEEGKLFDVVDARIAEDGGEREGEIAAVAELAGRCLHLNGRLRPTMRQVASELESIARIKGPSEQSHGELRDGVEPFQIDFTPISPFLSI